MLRFAAFMFLIVIGQRTDAKSKQQNFNCIVSSFSATHRRWVRGDFPQVAE